MLSPSLYSRYSVPIAMKEAVEKEFDRLKAEGILEKVKYSE
jgi:hypothetical protein